MTASVFLNIAAFLLSCQESTAFLPQAVPLTQENVYIINLQNASADEKLAATTLQGLVNRDEALLYVLLAKWDVFWLEQMKASGLFHGAKTLTLQEVLHKFSERVKKVFKYDPRLSGSINVATMMASIEDGIVVAQDTALGLPQSAEIIDLRGRWASNADAYAWALDNLFDKMNKQVLACYHPTACSHHLRDYLVAHRVFHFWVSSKDSPGVTEESHAQEMEVFERIMDSTQAAIPVLGFWYSGVDAGLDEYTGVGLAGQYGKITVVSDWASNFSFLGGCKADLHGAITEHNKRLAATPPPLQCDKIYICFDIVESGDAPSYLQSRQYEVWQDMARGKVPINWSLGPAIFDLAPQIAAYYYKEATLNDYIYMSMSGAGYCHPFRELFSKTADMEKCWNDYLLITQKYLKIMQCNVIGLYTDAWKPFRQNAAEPVIRRFLNELDGVDAIVLGMGRDEHIDRNSSNYVLEGHEVSIISHIMTRWPVDHAKKTREVNIDWLVHDIKAHAPNTLPGFMHVMALSWAFSPSDLQTVADRLGTQYVPLTIPQFNELFRLSVLRNDEKPG